MIRYFQVQLNLIHTAQIAETAFDAIKYAIDQRTIQDQIWLIVCKEIKEIEYKKFNNSIHSR